MMPAVFVLLVSTLVATPSGVAEASQAQPAPAAVTVSTAAQVQVEVAEVRVEPRPMTEAEMLAAMSPADRAAYRVARGDAAQAARYPNGRIPEELLCPLSFSDSMLRCDAAEALERAVQAGMPTVTLNASYRSIATQRVVQRVIPDLAAQAGRSRHGLGLAIDVPAEGGMQDWLRAHPEFGFVQPSWAKPSGVLPEPWHFEYRPS